MLEIIIPIFIISILILLNGVFVAAEFAIVTAARSRITNLAISGSKDAKNVLTILNSQKLQNRYITTAQVGITIVSLGLGMYGEHVFAGWLLDLFHETGKISEGSAHAIATVLSVGILTYLHVVIGEMIPKSLALQSAEKTTLILNRVMRIMEIIFAPGVSFLITLINQVTKLFRIPEATLESRLFSSEELEFIVEESFEGGLLETSDQLFIENILDLEQRTVEQAMTPRNKVHFLPSSSTKDEVIKTICMTSKTRFPVYKDELDQILGILHIKDFARAIAKEEIAENFYLGDLVRPTIFIPESLPLDELLIRFRRENLQIAIAFNEFGGTAGIITLEDIVEEVVGEIQDEFDKETKPIEEISPGIIRVQGNVILDEINQHYNLDWKHPEAHTIAGLIMSILGSIPTSKEKIVYKGVNLEVEQVDGHAINSVLIELPSSSPESE